MANTCAGALAACALRITRLTSDGSPDAGADNLYVSDALVSLTATAVIEEGTEVSQKNACGSVLFSAVGDDSLTRFDISGTIALPDPELMEMITGGTRLANGAAVGYAVPAIGPLSALGVGIELWQKRIDVSTGDQESAYPWNWWLLPNVKNLRIGDLTWDENAFVVPFNGRAFGNGEWYDGPQADWPFPTVASNRAIQYIPTTTIPTTVCGYASATGS